MSNAVHTLVALSLLGELGQVDGILVTHFVGVGSLRRVGYCQLKVGVRACAAKSALEAVARAK